MRQCFKSWFSYRYTWLTKTVTAKANLFRTLLKSLRKPLSAPRQVSVIQTYLSADKDAVNIIYDARKETDARTGISLRVAIAKELFKAEPEAVRQQWQQAVADRLEIAQARFREVKKGEPSSDPEDQAV